MATVSVPHQYPTIPAQSMDVPVSLQSSPLMKPLPSSVKTVAIVSSNGSQGGNGFNSFQLPSGAGTGYLQTNSVYLRFKLTVTATTATAWSFNNPLHSASSLVRLLTIMIGGQQVESILNYAETHQSLLLHTTNGNYVYGDSAIMEGSYSGAYNATNAYTVGTTYDFCIPVISGLFNGERSIPLFLLQAPIYIQFDYNGVGALIVGATNGGAGTADPTTAFTISNAQLVYTHIQVDDAYKQAIRQAMMSEGRLYQLNMNTFMNAKVTKGASNDLIYNVGANLSSIKAVLYTIANDSADSATVRTFKSRTPSNCQVLLDGTLVNNLTIDSIPMAYAEMNKAIGLLNDPVLSFAPGANVGGQVATSSWTLYDTVGFLGGVSTSRFNETGICMEGSPAQNIQLVLRTATNNASDIAYIFVLYEAILAVDAMGTVTLIR